MKAKRVVLFVAPSALWKGGREYWTAVINGERITLPNTGENYAALVRQIAAAKKAATAATAKRGRGRPPLSESGEVGARYQVHLPPSVADALRAVGGGSLSQGIIQVLAVARRYA